jgi:CRP-like cAMP-binding protein
VIFREGDLGDWLYVIVSGEVNVVRQGRTGEGAREIVLAQLGAGECLGEMALVSEQPRMATARSMGSVDALTVDQPAFEALFAHPPQLRRVFTRLIEMRLRPSAGDDGRRRNVLIVSPGTAEALRHSHQGA